MQANLDHGKAASGARCASRFVAILAGVPLVATLALSAPDRALAACGTSHPATAHAASSGAGSVHTATSTAPSGGGSGGGVGSGGCPTGSSFATPHGLPMAASGRVIEPGIRSAASTATHARTAATKTATTATRAASTTRTASASSAHPRAVKSRRP